MARIGAGQRLTARRSSASALTALLMLSACGGGGGAPSAPDDTVVDQDTGVRPPRDAGGGAGDAGSDASTVSNPDGPLVKVLSPNATEDPGSEDVVASSTLTVRCEAKKNPNGERVDPASVKVNVYSGDEVKPAVTQKAISTGEDEFEAQNIDLGAAAHGSIRIECEATDLATSMAERSAESITTLLDKGPEITFLNPQDKGFVPAGVGMGEDVRVRFRVAPRPLGDGDTGAGVSEIKATVGGKPIAKLDESTTEENVYSFGLDFNDTQLFSVVPATLSIRIDASNARTPKPRAVTSTLGVGVDSEGPTITVRSPQRSGGFDAVVSGKVDVVLEVKDALAGVDPESVEIRIEKKVSAGEAPGKDVYPAELQGTMFVASFETGTYAGLASLSITLIAKDKAGIETQSNLPVDIDPVPPWISLDPPNVRERYIKANGIDECTGSFDPLGTRDPLDSHIEMINDGASVLTGFRPRVLVWDRALQIPNVVTRVAMIKAGTPRLYIQHNASSPLLVDSDHDANHECDAINVNAQNPSLAPVTITLTPLVAAGTGPHPGDWVETPPGSKTYVFSRDFGADPSGVGLCDSALAGTQYPPPQPLATDTNLTRVINHTVQGGGSVVYVDSPSPTGLRNTGKDYDSPREGWACMVATATDNAGNEAFSEPIRGCFGGKDGHPCDIAAIPTCTDGCVIPAQFRKDAPNAMPRILQYR